MQISYTAPESACLEFALLSVGTARDIVRGDSFCGPERHLATVVIEHGVRGVGVRRVWRLWPTIPDTRHAANTVVG